MELRPVAKVTSAQLAADQILALIRRGVWQPGDQLPSERELTYKLKVGRSTVREALQILSTLNLVQVIPGQGSYIKELGSNDLFRPEIISLLVKDSAILDLLATREMIEPQTVRLACLRATEDELVQIAEMLDDHERALEKGEPVAEYARTFHLMLAEASHNGVAAVFIRSILDLLQERRRADMTMEMKRRELHEHREVLRLVRDRDGEAAASYLIRHIVASAVNDVSAEHRDGVNEIGTDTTRP
jgi:GntR family transcriptional repressor for pyruvate dehydrogenase complex